MYPEPREKYHLVNKQTSLVKRLFFATDIHHKFLWRVHPDILYPKQHNKEIAALFMPILKEHGVDADPAYVEKVVGMMKDRVSFIKDLWDVCAFFFVAPTEYDEKTRKKRWKEDSAAQLTEFIEVLRAHEPFDIESTENAAKAWIESKGYHLGNIMNATRLALVGEGKGPHIFDITEALGKEESIRRIQRAIEVLG